MLSDHGEEFGEHGGTGHGRTLYREVVHVPFFIHRPGLREAVRIDRPVSTVSLLPTLAELLGEEPRAHWECPSLVPLLRWDDADPSPIVSELLRNPEDLRAEVRSVIHAEHHLHRSRFRNSPAAVEELFNLTTDPGETVDLHRDRRDRAAELSALLDDFATHAPAGDWEFVEIEVDAETREHLESLGYLEP